MIYCLFEQSGTFKNEFIKLGIPAKDYDILNDFNQTDFVIDLYDQIRKGFENQPSIFDNISANDLVLAFFPCTRFEAQVIMWFNGSNWGARNWSDEQKLEYDLKLNKELAENYELVTKLTLICLRKGLKLIIENPYSEQHYLTRYWAIKPKVIDLDRRLNGDYYKKPTQYWFINCEPENNILFEPIEYIEHKSIVDTHDKVERSLISKQYANRFIRQYIIKED